jgi:hypothetical protein
MTNKKLSAYYGLRGSTYPASRMGCLMPNISVMGVVIVAIVDEEGLVSGLEEGEKS